LIEKELIMQINLRKANAIQAEIRRAITAVDAKDTIAVNEYTADVAREIMTAENDYINAMTRKEDLTIALYNIRKSVSVANAREGVGELLGDIEKIDTVIKLLESTLSVRTRFIQIDEVNKRLDKIRTAPADTLRGYDRDVVTTGVVSDVTKNSAKQRIKGLRKARQELQDKLLAINVNITIDVGADDVRVLGEEGIL
jgi:hypothetical protein